MLLYAVSYSNPLLLPPSHIIELETVKSSRDSKNVSCLFISVIKNCYFYHWNILAKVGAKMCQSPSSRGTHFYSAYFKSRKLHRQQIKLLLRANSSPQYVVIRFMRYYSRKCNYSAPHENKWFTGRNTCISDKIIHFCGADKARSAWEWGAE